MNQKKIDGSSAATNPSPVVMPPRHRRNTDATSAALASAAMPYSATRPRATSVTGSAIVLPAVAHFHASHACASPHHHARSIVSRAIRLVLEAAQNRNDLVHELPAAWDPDVDPAPDRQDVDDHLVSEKGRPRDVDVATTHDRHS